MEMTSTFFIWFALIIPIILTLFFISTRINRFILKFDFRVSANFFQQFYNYSWFLFSKPDRWFC